MIINNYSQTVIAYNVLGDFLVSITSQTWCNGYMICTESAIETGKALTAMPPDNEVAYLLAKGTVTRVKIIDMGGGARLWVAKEIWLNEELGVKLQSAIKANPVWKVDP